MSGTRFVNPSLGAAEAAARSARLTAAVVQLERLRSAHASYGPAAVHRLIGESDVTPYEALASRHSVARGPLLAWL